MHSALLLTLTMLAPPATLPPLPIPAAAEESFDDDEEDIDEVEEEDMEEEEEAPRRRRRVRRERPAEPDTSLPVSPIVSNALIGGGACLASGATYGAGLALALVTAWIPCIGCLSSAYALCASPFVSGMAGGFAGQELARRVARRRAPLLPLLGAGLASVGGGYLLAVAVTLGAMVTYLVAINAAGGLSTRTPSEPQILLLSGVAAATTTLTAIGSFILYGSFVLGAAAVTAVVAALGRDMQPTDDGSGMDLLEVPDPAEAKDAEEDEEEED